MRGIHLCLVFCERNPPLTCWFPSQGPTRREAFPCPCPWRHRPRILDTISGSYPGFLKSCLVWFVTDGTSNYTTTNNVMTPPIKTETLGNWGIRVHLDVELFLIGKGKSIFSSRLRLIVHKAKISVCGKTSAYDKTPVHDPIHVGVNKT